MSDRDIRKWLGAAWETDLRNEVGRGEADEADVFLSSARRIYDWVNRSNGCHAPLRPASRSHRPMHMTGK